MFCWRTEKKSDRLSFQTWTWPEPKETISQETNNQLTTTTTGASTTLIDLLFRIEIRIFIFLLFVKFIEFMNSMIDQKEWTRVVFRKFIAICKK